jgi:hypothetical protein
MAKVDLTAIILAKGVIGVKWKARINPISVVSLVLAMVLALPGVGCSATPSPASNTDSSSMPAGISLTVSEPEDNTITDVATIEVEGHTDPGAVVSVNAVVTIADANGNFDAIVSLNEGPNTIEIVASDETGSQASVTLIVTLVKGG